MAQLGRQRSTTSPALVRPLSRGGVFAPPERGSGTVGTALTSTVSRVASVGGSCSLGTALGGGESKKVAATGTVAVGFSPSGNYASATSATVPAARVLIYTKAPHPSWLTVPPPSTTAAPVIAGTTGATHSPLGLNYSGTALTGLEKKIAKISGACTVGATTRATRPVSPGTQSGRGGAGFATTVTGIKKIVTVAGRVTFGAGSRANPGKAATVAGYSTAGFATLYARTIITSAGFTHVLVTHDYDLATGDAPTGTVHFTPSAWLVNDGVTLVAATLPANLDVDGVITISLAANTDPGTQPAGSCYVVQEEIIGQPQRVYRVRVPHNAGPVIDLSTLPVL